MTVTLTECVRRTETRWCAMIVQDDVTDVTAYPSLREALDDLIDVAGRSACVSVLRDAETIRDMARVLPSSWMGGGVADLPEALVVADSYDWRDGEEYAVLVPYGFARELRDIAVTGEALERWLRESN